MALAGGQDMLSPYQAMGNDPVSGTDPGGLEPQANRLPDQNIPNVNPFVHAIVSWANPGFGGYSPEAIKDMTPGSSPDVDPMNLSYWYDHQVGSDGKVYTLYRDMDGNIISATAGDGNNNSGKVATNEEKNNDGQGTNGKGNGDSQQSNDNSLDKPNGTMTLSQANKWFHIGNGEGVYIDFTKIVLPKSLTVESFKNSPYKIDGSHLVYIHFDGKDFVNPN